nr:hypothetical protein [Tanacetum cinerariifolium]
MRRIGKGFSGVETPLFDAMLVQQQYMIMLKCKRMRMMKDYQAQAKGQEVIEDEENQAFRVKEIEEGGKIADLDADEVVSLTDVDAEVEMDASIHGRMEESQAKVYNLYLQHSKKVLSMQDTYEAEPTEMKEVLEVVTAAKLMIEVVTTTAPITTAAQVSKASAPRKRRGDDVIEQVKRREKHDNTIMRYQALKRKHVTEAQERKNMMIYLKNMAGFKMDFFKDMTFNDIRPIFEKHYNSIQAFLEKGEEI